MKKQNTILALVAAVALTLAAPEVHASVSAADEFCALTRAQGDAQSALLAGGEVFTNLGDPSTGNNSVTVGVRKSLSKHRQAGTVDKLSAAQCEAFRLEEKLSQQAEKVELRSELLSLTVAEPLLRAALAAAEANLKEEEKLLAAKMATLSDLRVAFEQVEALRAELATLARRRAQLQGEVPELEESLEELASKAISARAEVSALSSKLTSQSGWDVAVAAGSRTNTGATGRSGAFVAVTATMSLGKVASDAATARVGSLAHEFLSAQRDGGVQTLIRARDSVKGILAGEDLALQSLVSRKNLLLRTLNRVEGVGTTDALRMKRSLQVDLQAVDARTAAARKRIDHLQAWLERNA